MQPLQEIQRILKVHTDPAALAAHRKFVPGAEKMYGVGMPVLNMIAKQFRKADFDLVQALWKSGSFEEKTLAAKLLEKIATKDPDQYGALST